jgi:hypothetical protein
VIRFEPQDVDARWDRAVLMAEVGDVRNACREFEKLHAERPGDVEVTKMLARVRAYRVLNLQAFGIVSDSRKRKEKGACREDGRRGGRQDGLSICKPFGVVGNCRNTCRGREKVNAERPADVKVAKMLTRVRPYRVRNLQAFWQCGRLQKRVQRKKKGACRGDGSRGGRQDAGVREGLLAY